MKRILEVEKMIHAREGRMGQQGRSRKGKQLTFAS